MTCSLEIAGSREEFGNGKMDMRYGIWISTQPSRTNLYSLLTQKPYELDRQHPQTTLQNSLGQSVTIFHHTT